MYLSEQVPLNTKKLYVEDEVDLTGDTVIDEGFLMEIYANEEGKRVDNDEGFSTIVYFDKDTHLADIFKLDRFDGFYIYNETIAINVFDPKEEEDMRFVAMDVSDLVKG